MVIACQHCFLSLIIQNNLLFSALCLISAKSFPRFKHSYKKMPGNGFYADFLSTPMVLFFSLFFSAVAPNIAKIFSDYLSCKPACETLKSQTKMEKSGREREKKRTIKSETILSESGKNSTDIVIVRRDDEIVMLPFPLPLRVYAFRRGWEVCGTENVYF